MQSLTITDTQSDLVIFSPTDASGNPGAYTGTPVWVSDNTAVATVTVSATNPLQATVKGVTPGTANISITLQQMNAGAPGGNTTVSFAVTITGGGVTSGTFSFAPAV